jgi:hypothetical protein
MFVILAISQIEAQDTQQEAPDTQPGEIPKPRQEIIYASDPGTPDMVEMLTRYNDPQYSWPKALSLISTFKFYAGNLVVDSPTNTESNRFLILQSHDVFRSVTRDLHLNTSMEIGVLKPGVCLSADGDIDKYTDLAVDTMRNVYQSGGNLGSMAIDTATVNCGYSKYDAGKLVGLWTVRVEQKAFKLFGELEQVFPDTPIVPLAIGDIEPYPALNPFEHMSYIDSLVKERARLGFPPIAFYDLDIDTKRIGSDMQVFTDLTMIINYLHSQGIKVGIIVNGDDSRSPETDTDEYYLRTANEKLVKYYELSLFDKVDRVIIQSWATKSTGQFDYPFNVPENRMTHTWFVSHVVGCILKTENCGFPQSPQ